MMIFNPSLFSKARLPKGYTELEYIQNTGESYIDLRFKPNQTTKVNAEFEYVSDPISMYSILFGSRVGYMVRQFDVWVYSDLPSEGIRITYADSGGIFGSTMGNSYLLTAGAMYNFELGHAYFKCPELGIDYEFESDEDFECPYNLSLFGLNNSGNTKWFAFVKVYGFTAEHNGELIRNLVPAIRDSDSTVGMYDTVSGTFFTNAGTGTFIGGNPV